MEWKARQWEYTVSIGGESPLPNIFKGRFDKHVSEIMSLGRRG